MGLAGTFSGHKNLKEGAWPLLLSPLAPLWAGAPGGTLLRGEVEGVQGGWMSGCARPAGAGTSFGEGAAGFG